MTAAVRIENLSKSYQVSHASPRGNYGYKTLRDEIVGVVRSSARALRGRKVTDADTGSEDFWALRDVAFEVQPGEVVGVVGRNGAGKSTLLKVLSRITKPTSGRVELRGRVGSLLEVGTGFHPELTGRENVYLNGAILGMRRAEIHRKFDDIVAFAEVERFLDTPVKRYSSGMYVRLAFAVAAYLEPEILIVDEVLAVGDMAFQRKCMGRMREVGRGGTTVLFVSHNMPAVETLCDRGILMDGGRVLHDGSVPEVINEYLKRVMTRPGADEVSPLDRSGPGRPVRAFRSAEMLDVDGRPTNFIALGDPFHVRLGLDVKDAIDHPTIGVCIDDTLGQRVLTLHTPTSRADVPRVEGRCQVECRVNSLPLAPGDYAIKVSLWSMGNEVDDVERVLYFTVVNGEAFGEGRGHSRGVCVAPSSWQLVRPS